MVFTSNFELLKAHGEWLYGLAANFALNCLWFVLTELGTR